MTLNTKQPPIPELRRAFLKRLVSFAVTANLLIAGLAAFFLWQSKALYESRAETTAQNLACSLADHITGEVDTIDLTLLLVADEVEEQLAKGGINEAELNTFIARHQARLKMLDGLRIATANGENAFGTGLVPGSRPSISDRSYFIRLRDDPAAGMVISEPVIGRVSHKHSIILARRLNHPDGSFAGLVYGAITLRHFATAFSAIDVGPHGTISLRDDQLALVTRLPEPGGELLGKRNASPEFQQSVLRHPESCTYRSAMAFDHIDRTYSYHKSAHGSLYVIVGLATEDYLAAWRREATWTLALVAVFVLGTCLSSSLIYRGFMRQALAIQALAEQEKTLRESETRFRSLLQEVQNVAVHGFGPDGKIQYWNKACERLFGFSEQEATGRKLVDLIIQPERRAKVEQDIAHTSQTGRPIPSSELSHVRKDGSRVAVLSNHVVVQVPGRPPEFFCISIDLTSRKEAEDALRKSQAELEAISNSTPIMMCLVTPQHQVERMNRAMTEFVKDTVHQIPCSVGGLLGCIQSLKTGCGLGEACSTCALRLAIHKTLDTGLSSRQIEFQLNPIKGTVQHELYLSASTTPVHLGQETKVLVCLENITAQKQLTVQLFQAQKMEAIGQLAGGVAHDFNNILAASLMNIDLLKSTPNLNPEVLSGLDELEELTHRATRLTRQLLVFSRRQLLQTGRLDLQKLVARMMTMVGRLLGEQIEISALDSNGSSDGFWVNADAGMMEQVVLNLCVNARDAMPKGGRLAITLKPITVGEEQARQQPEARAGRFVCLTVSDTGCGMSEETIKRIFEPFFTTKELGKGTGLGLATVYGIIKQHKGWIHVESAPGRGTAFQVYLPACEEPL